MPFLARSEHPQATIECVQLDVAGEFKRMADYFEGLAAERALDFTLKGSGTVVADPILLRRALANLVSNAIQYADSDSTILLSSSGSEHDMTLRIENDGEAIPALQLPRLFDPFLPGRRVPSRVVAIERTWTVQRADDHDNARGSR